MAPARRRRKSSHSSAIANGNKESLQKTEEEENQCDTTPLPNLPDHVIGKILGLLPTKLAVRVSLVSKQWGNIWSQVPVLDFDDEYDPSSPCNDNRERSNLFTKYLEKCLDHYKQSQRKNVPLERFRLRAASYGSAELISTSSVDEWLNFAVKEGVRELDISLSHRGVTIIKRYFMPAKTLLNAKFLTTLSLEYVKLGNITNDKVGYDYTPPASGREILFPSLKTVSLRAVVLEDIDSLPCFLLGCPAIHYLALTMCSFSSIGWRYNQPLIIRSSSLKSLQITNGEFPTVHIHEAANLQSFTVTKTASLIKLLVLKGCQNLKDISISGQSLEHLSFEGNLNPRVFSMKAPNLSSTAYIILRYDEEQIGISLWPFPKLRDFLEKFDCFERLLIRHEDVQALVFPEDFITNNAPPLPSVKTIAVRIDEADKAIESDLKRSLHWMAPSAKVE